MKGLSLIMANIRHTLLSGTSPETVYRVLTTAEGLSAWWTPNTQASPEAGTVAVFPFESGYVKKMNIAELRPGEFIKWICIQGDQEWVGTTITFSLLQRDVPLLIAEHPEISGQADQNPVDVKTLLMFEHNGWADYSPSFAECSYTWAQFLRSLKLLCETGTGKPWPTQHTLE